MDILIVDDNQDARMILRETLQTRGHVVSEAANGKDALKKARKNKPDMIISDILMPVMDGFALCREVRQDEALKDLPFVFCTATYLDEKDEKLALELGADRFIRKPVDPAVFISTISEVADAAKKRRTPVSPSRPEVSTLKLYNERLINKLEKKTADLESEIAKRRRVEAELRLFRTLAEQSNDAYLVSNTQTGALFDVNKKACENLGYSREELLKKRITDIEKSMPDLDAWQRVVAKAKKDGSIIREAIHRRKDGQTFPVEVSAKIVTHQGREYAVAIARDMTERKRLENQILQAQKMEAIGRLAGGVAHDFNNMLSIIIGYADLALNKLSQSDPLYKDLSEILKAGRRSADITRQLLAFARKQTIAPRKLDINETIGNSIKMLGRLIGEDIDLRFIQGENLWPVLIDPAQVDQILANLAVNARDAINGVGTISIETKNVTFDDGYCSLHHDVMPGQYVMLAFSDSGAGMDEETRDKAFEPFFTTKGEGKGTGLGLSTVFGIVKQNKGFISLYSEPGSGTTFKLYFPRHTGPDVKIEKKKKHRPMTGTETILLVEDEQQILDLCTQVLERKGYKVISARLPGEAILLCGKYDKKIHLLITDVVMPDMTGKELRERIGTLKPGIKALFMSGYTADIIAHRGVLDKGVSFIQKPFSIHELSAKVRRMLDEGNDE